MSSAYKIAGAILIVVGIIVAFLAAGSMDGGATILTLLFLVLAAVALLVSGIALIKAAEELAFYESIEEDEEPRSYVIRILNIEKAETDELDYSVKERKSSCS